MRKTTSNTLLLTTLTLLLSACTTTEVSAQAATKNPCGNLNTPSRLLKLQLDEFEVVLKRKKKMCLDFRPVNKGMFRIKVDAGDSGYTWDDGPITVEGKTNAPGHPVISGSNSADEPETVVVNVTDASVPIPSSADYDYWIKVPGVGMLDPKVRIIRQDSGAPLWVQDIEVALQDVGVTLEEVGLDRVELERRLDLLLRPQKPVQTESY